MKFDVIVVGSGHAGVEASAAAARMGVKTLCITMSGDQIGTMSCNPAIGGLGKSHLAREIDVLGGLMCRVADRSAMQYRILNEKKGVAVRATRVQVDRHQYREEMKFELESLPSFRLMQGQVQKLLFEGSNLIGVETAVGQKLFASQVVITTGTFMNGKAHIGRENFQSGRAGEPPSIGLSDFLKTLGIKIGRFKTGTVPRVDGRTVDFSKFEAQHSHAHSRNMSFFSKIRRLDLLPAYIGHTNDKTHEIIRSGLDQSPLYSGIIESRGPRYCPSVEDKIVRFADKDRHQIFLEQEGRKTVEHYVGGLSTSLPYDLQLKFLRSIPGMESVEIVRPGYAIEYDYIDATQLQKTLELKNVPGLFFAGQVNGTSGYEEAAAQGLIAGVNAAAKAKNINAFIPTRADSYLGILIDDLTRTQATEPYRMMTSRAEHRLALREDNVVERMLPYSKEFQLLGPEDERVLEGLVERKQKLKTQLQSIRLTPTAEVNAVLAGWENSPLKSPATLADLARRPNLNLQHFKESPWLQSVSYEDHDLESVITDIKYEGYIGQANQQMNQLRKMLQFEIPSDFSYEAIQGLSREAIDRLNLVKPKNLEEASGLEGVSPSSISVLAVHLSRRRQHKDSCATQSAFV